MKSTMKIIAIVKVMLVVYVIAAIAVAFHAATRCNDVADRWLKCELRIGHEGQHRAASYSPEHDFWYWGEGVAPYRTRVR